MYILYKYYRSKIAITIDKYYNNFTIKSKVISVCITLTLLYEKRIKSNNRKHITLKDTTGKDNKLLDSDRNVQLIDAVRNKSSLQLCFRIGSEEKEEECDERDKSFLQHSKCNENYNCL